MTARRSIVVIENFYADPHRIRQFALAQDYYTPYEASSDIGSGRVQATWWASKFKLPVECPFKGSEELIHVLELAVGEQIDRDHWSASFPVDFESKPSLAAGEIGPTCLWNCCFHVKPDNGQRLGQGVHNHVTDTWNSVGEHGWAGIIYLNPESPVEGGLHLWQNVDSSRNFDWMTSPGNWELIDSFGNRFNRLLLVRGDLPHSGAGGWGDSLENGRMYQTFFFKTLAAPSDWPQLSIPNGAS